VTLPLLEFRLAYMRSQAAQLAQENGSANLLSKQDDSKEEILEFKENPEDSEQKAKGQYPSVGPYGYPKVPCRRVNTEKCPASDYGFPDAEKGIPDAAKTCPLLKAYACPFLYKAPASKGAEAEVEKKIAEAVKKKEQEYQGTIEKLEKRIAELEDEAKKRAAEGTTEKLMSEGHIAPAQKDSVTKLLLSLPPQLVESTVSIFEKQKLVPVGEETGKQETKREGEFSQADDARIAKEQGIDTLVDERGVPKRKEVA